MSSQSSHWEPIKRSIESVINRNMVIAVVVMFLFPAAESVLVNFWTSSPNVLNSPAFWSFIVFVGMHLVLGIMSLTGDSCAVKNLPEAIETEEKLKEAQREIDRKTAGLRMIRGSIDSFNYSTCALNLPYSWCESGYTNGLKPIIDNITANITSTIGITSNRFTLEIYYTIDGIADWQTCNEMSNSLVGMGNNMMILGYYFDSQQGSRNAAVNLLYSNRSPAILGTTENVPTLHQISDHPGVFMVAGKRHPDVYFNRYATVPFNFACSDTNNRLGIIVLTSMQENPFSDDALDLLGFLGSLVANYTIKYNECVWHRQNVEIQKNAKKLEDAKKAERAERKRLKQEKALQAGRVATQSDDDDDEDGAE